MRTALAVLLLGCGSSASQPGAPALGAIEGEDLRCATRDGIGLAVDDRCAPITLDPATWFEEEPDNAELVRGDGATFAHHAGGSDRGWIVRIDGRGETRRVAIPGTSGARLTVVAAARPLLVAVLNGVGTMIFDARTLEGLAGWERMGGWFNATTFGASASEDGAWLTVPDPYGERIDLIRVADLTAVGSIHLADLTRDAGPGRVSWFGGGLQVRTFPLPFE